MAAYGAYGFALETTNGHALPDLIPAGSDADSVAVSWAHGSSLVDAAEVRDDNYYRLAWRGGGLLEIDRAPAAVRMTLPEPVSAAAVVHPLLTMPLAFLAHWRGDVT